MILSMEFGDWAEALWGRQKTAQELVGRIALNGFFLPLSPCCFFPSPLA